MTELVIGSLLGCGLALVTVDQIGRSKIRKAASAKLYSDIIALKQQLLACEHRNHLLSVDLTDTRDELMSTQKRVERHLDDHFDALSRKGSVKMATLEVPNQKKKNNKRKKKDE